MYECRDVDSSSAAREVTTRSGRWMLPFDGPIDGEGGLAGDYGCEGGGTSGFLMIYSRFVAMPLDLCTALVGGASLWNAAPFCMYVETSSDVPTNGCPRGAEVFMLPCPGGKELRDETHQALGMAVGGRNHKLV